MLLNFERNVPVVVNGKGGRRDLYSSYLLKFHGCLKKPDNGIVAMQRSD